VDYSAIHLEYLQEAVRAAFWRIDALKVFLRRCGVSEKALLNLTKETGKRKFLDELFPRIEAHSKGSQLLAKLQYEILNISEFTDLKKWENATELITEAKNAQAVLRDCVAKKQDERQNEKDKQRRRKDAEERRSREASYQLTQNKLKNELDELAARIGSQKAGYEFEQWIGRLCSLHELDYRSPYKTTDGSQIDGSVTILDVTYLLSLKFTKSPCKPIDIADHQDKVKQKADMTLGIVISMSGFTEASKSRASLAETKLLLFDYSHIYSIVTGIYTLQEVVARIRRYASRTGKCYLSIDKFAEPT